MKRFFALLLICMAGVMLACAKTPEKEAAPAPVVTAPGETEITLWLPLGARDDLAKAIPAYTTGFAAKNGEALTFAAASDDPAVAEGLLRADGTLYVIAHGAGEAKLTVTARTEDGEEAASVVSVKVSDARRMLVLIVLGVLAAVLLVLLGKPVKKQPEEAQPEPAAAPEPDPKPNDHFERS